MPRAESRWLPHGFAVASAQWDAGLLTVHGIEEATQVALPLECIVGVHLSRIVTLGPESGTRHGAQPGESGRDPLAALTDAYMLYPADYSLAGAATTAEGRSMGLLTRATVDGGIREVSKLSALKRRVGSLDAVESTVVADLISAGPLCCLRVVPEVLEPDCLGAARTSSSARNVRVLLDLLRPSLPSAWWLLAPDSVEAPAPSGPRGPLPTSWQPPRARDIVEFAAAGEWLLNLACAAHDRPS
jgi:hypothetical protein